jgi:hypothetical protein
LLGWSNCCQRKDCIHICNAIKSAYSLKLPSALNLELRKNEKALEAISKSPQVSLNPGHHLGSANQFLLQLKRNKRFPIFPIIETMKNSIFQLASCAFLALTPFAAAECHGSSSLFCDGELSKAFCVDSISCATDCHFTQVDCNEGSNADKQACREAIRKCKISCECSDIR